MNQPLNQGHLYNKDSLMGSQQCSYYMELGSTVPHLPITVLSRKSAHGWTILQVCQRGGWVACSFLLLAVRKSREPGNEARGRGLRLLNDEMFTATRCPRSKYNLLTTSGFEVGSRWQQNSERHHVTVSRHGLACGAHVPQ